MQYRIYCAKNLESGVLANFLKTTVFEDLVAASLIL